MATPEMTAEIHLLGHFSNVRIFFLIIVAVRFQFVICNLFVIYFHASV
jgi:hypothetical protein